MRAKANKQAIANLLNKPPLSLCGLLSCIINNVYFASNQPPHPPLTPVLTQTQYPPPAMSLLTFELPLEFNLVFKHILFSALPQPYWFTLISDIEDRGK